MNDVVDRLRGTGDLVERVTATVRDQDWDELRDRVEGFVDARPVVAVSIAAVAGFMLGRLLR
jgi:ElaB/YqjD/DUF883 family membrane-anchored ribosome-binding protein